MHPYVSGEMARLRAEEFAREAAIHHHHSIRRPAFTPAGFLFGVSLRHAIRTRWAEAGARDRIGMTLIRIGLRFVDPADLHRIGSNR
ncbi:MAG TPA: hypothetical protein VMM13_09765 [Euzebya sp.]|nr:hypothetical protein [Euzebya sp.]